MAELQIADSTPDYIKVASSLSPICYRKFSFVIPAYNEERRIETILDHVSQVIDKYSLPWEVVVSVDGDDSTWDIVSSYSEEYSFIRGNRTGKRSGKGQAIKRALEIIESEFVVLLDADSSVDLLDVIDAIKYLERYEAVIMSRYSTSNNIPLLRKVASRGFNAFLRLLLNLDLNDTQSGYKLFRCNELKEAFKKVTVTNTFFDVALLFYMSRSGSKVIEIPTTYNYDFGSKFHLATEVVGQGISLLAFAIRHSFLFRIFPKWLGQVYYKVFRWI